MRAKDGSRFLEAIQEGGCRLGYSILKVKQIEAVSLHETNNRSDSCLLGLVTPNLLPIVHVSHMGLVPKPHQPNKFRLIVDLSSPGDKSVNDGIPSDLCSLKYASVDDAVTMVKTLGRGTMLVKIDLKEAYHLIPVHPDDYHLLGVTWQGHTYVDQALPFGLCSAPKFFTAFANFLAWVLHQHGITHKLHYLDDFLFLGAPLSDQAARALETACRVFHMLGVPISTHKTEGPATYLSHFPWHYNRYPHI